MCWLEFNISDSSQVLRRDSGCATPESVASERRCQSGGSYRRLLAISFWLEQIVDWNASRIDNLEEQIGELLGQLRILERIHASLDPVKDSVTRGFLLSCATDLRRQVRDLNQLLERITGGDALPQALGSRRALRPPALVYFS
jgi:hypothetical protein